MTTDHNRVLAEIEHRLTNQNTPPEDIDAAIAAELGVPRDHYFAYLLVWGAVEAYEAARDEPRAIIRRLPGSSTGQGPHATHHQRLLDEARKAVDQIGASAAWSYTAATERRLQPDLAADQAAWILGRTIVLRQALRDLATYLHADLAPKELRRAR